MGEVNNFVDGRSIEVLVMFLYQRDAFAHSAKFWYRGPLFSNFLNQIQNYLST